MKVTIKRTMKFEMNDEEFTVLLDALSTAGNDKASRMHDELVNAERDANVTATRDRLTRY